MTKQADPIPEVLEVVLNAHINSGQTNIGRGLAQLRAETNACPHFPAANTSEVKSKSASWAARIAMWMFGK